MSLRFRYILRKALGVVFGRRALWTVVVADDTEEAIRAAQDICPAPLFVIGTVVELILPYRKQWRVQYIYKGQP